MSSHKCLSLLLVDTPVASSVCLGSLWGHNGYCDGGCAALTADATYQGSVHQVRPVTAFHQWGFYREGGKVNKHWAMHWWACVLEGVGWCCVVNAFMDKLMWEIGSLHAVNCWTGHWIEKNILLPLQQRKQSKHDYYGVSDDDEASDTSSVCSDRPLSYSSRWCAQLDCEPCVMWTVESFIPDHCC